MLGAGTAIDPFIVSTPTDLNNVRNNLSGYYELANDIDMTGFGNFVPIGKAAPYFTGTFDGKGYKIKNLTVNETTHYSGLFGLLENGTIKNLGIENASVTSTLYYNGIFAGYMSGTAIIENCYSTGQITAYAITGGIVGQMQMQQGSRNLINCYSHASVTNTDYATGGLVGSGNSPTVENCYSTGLVSSQSTTQLGGLIGSTIDGTITSSYWDTQTSGRTTSASGTGKTTAEMKTQSTYVNWNFTDVWSINGDYPTLRAFGTIVPPVIATVNVSSYIKPIVAEINVTKTTRNVKQVSVLSFINPVVTSVERKSKTVKNLISYVRTISGTAQTKEPEPVTVIVNGFSSYNVNPSFNSIQQDNSHLSYINNPSFTVVIE